MPVNEKNSLKMFELTNRKVGGLGSCVALAAVNAEANVSLCKKIFIQNYFSPYWFGSTVKLGYNEHAWDWPNVFVTIGIRYNRVG
jgi:hypothetical protein